MRGYTGFAPGRSLGALAAVLFLAGLLIGPAEAQNTNLTATAKYSASTYWQSDSDPPNPNFTPEKAFDGNLSTRWNSYAGDADGSWLAARWDQPVTVNKVIVRQAFNRLAGLRAQTFDAAKNDWVDAVVAEDAMYEAVKGGDPANPTYSMRFPSVKTTGIRILFTQTTVSSISIFEVEAYDNPAGTLTGTVRDDKGAAIAGAIVSAGTDQTTTDANGKYTLIADAGTYNVTAGKPGAFRNKLVRSVAIAANGTATLDFALTALPPNLARTGTAASSSDWEDGTDYNAAKANDGNLTTRWNARADDEDGAWLEVGWSSPQTFSKVQVRQAFDRIRNYTLQQWDAAAADWKDLVTNVAVPVKGGDVQLTNTFGQPITTTKVRLLVVEADAVASVYEILVSNPATATIKGVVKDAVSGQPVAGALVSSDLGDSAVADNNGAFSMVVDADDYVFSATAPGYFQGAGVPVTITQGQTQEITIQLPPPGENLAKTAKPIASSEESGQAATAINDGDLESYWQVAADKHFNEWVGLQWDKATKFTVVQLRGIRTLVQISYLEYLAEDGKTWVPLPETTYTAERGPDKDFFLPKGVTTTAVRWFIKENYNAADNPGLAEMLVFNSPIPE
jgi:hypothetical protein